MDRRRPRRPRSTLAGTGRPAQPADADLPDTGVGLALERRLSPAFIRGQDYGTRASTVVAIGHDGHGVIIERRWGPMGVALGQTRLPIGRL